MVSHYAFSLIRLIPFVLILIGAILIKQRTNYASPILLVIGQAIMIIPLLISFIPPSLLYDNGAIQSVSIIYSISGGISIIGGVTFGIGMLLFAKDLLSKEPKSVL